MPPKKPMLDRLYFDGPKRELVYPWVKDFFERYGVKNIDAERDTLSYAIKGSAYFDAGTLPEVVVRPPKDNAVYKANYMFPNKELRDRFYESLESDKFDDGYDFPKNFDRRLYINRLWELYNKSQKPIIRNVRSSILNPVRLYELIKGGDTDRANYNPTLNKINVSPDFVMSDTEAELAHAYQHYGTDFPRKYGWVRSLTSLPGDIKINGKSGYDRIGNLEFDAHKIIEPLFHDYLTHPEIQYSDTHEIMLDMLQNPDAYFRNVEKGPFKGSTVLKTADNLYGNNYDKK